VGNAAGSTVIILVTGERGLPHMSVPVQVSVIVPPHPPGDPLNVDRLDVPFIKQAPLNPFVKDIVEAAGVAPQGILIATGAVIVGNDAGLTVITLDTGVNGRPQASVAVHVSVIVPPQAPGAALKVDGFEVPLIKHVPLNPFV
jgi:hypothetical protein